MVVKSDKNSAQFNLRLEKAFGQNSALFKSFGAEAAQAMREEVANLTNSIREDIEEQNKSLTDEFIDKVKDSNALEKGASNAVNTALGQLLAGRDLNPRTIANSAARAFTPAVDDFFRESAAQVAGDFSDLLGLAQRNL